MGTCCFGNRPSGKFVGTWTDDQYVELTINEDGRISYQKLTEHRSANFVGPTRFTDNDFFYCCCCCVLRGTYANDEDSEPKVIANGQVLIRKKQGL